MLCKFTKLSLENIYLHLLTGIIYQPYAPSREKMYLMIRTPSVDFDQPEHHHSLAVLVGQSSDSYGGDA